MSDLTPEDVREILRLVDESDLEEFELETSRFTLRVGPRAPEASNRLLQAEDGVVDVTAPMVGTFYRSPTPGAAPFVEVGSEVDEGTQLCILEVMKLMNSVVAGVRGVVAEVCVENAAPVQFGDVLFRVRAT
ncbi:MAG TPA: biotin/lipoyl-containing protein [Gaiellaceae bacterium]|nr:biotin/lipoyl-containing protein [Gaiellaceae bacterium]